MKKVKIITRIISVVCCIMMATSVCNAQNLKGSGTESDPYLISSQSDLETFAKDVNSGISYDGKFIKLTDNIECDYNENNQWTPIGNFNKSFQGTFDGNGKTISKLYYDNSYQNYVGLFGNNQGTIKNVGVVDSYFNGQAGIGGVCGYNYEGTITNCYNTGEFSGNNEVGGVCGYNENGTIENCYNTGEFSGGEYSCNVGGVCGDNYYGTITNCYNTGEVSGNSDVGGVCGYNYGTITNCYNTGEVSGYTEVGGVCGDNYNATITNCYYLSDTDNGKDAKTKEQFNNGCVAYKLSQGKNGDVWGQDLSNSNSLPTLYGSKVYKTDNKYANSDNGFLADNNYEEPRKYNNDVYLIANAGNLYWFAQYVNNGNVEANAILTDNIEVNELNTTKTFREWTPIGNEDKPYKGTFDGNEKTISGLYKNSNQNYVGLFGNNQGTIKNVGVVKSYFKGNQAIGGVCGLNNGTITNCYNTDKVSGSQYIGGVCGYNYEYSSTITNCYNIGEVRGTESIGGVCGENYNGDITNCYTTGKVSGVDKVGGVCGYTNSGTITNCYNTGEVSGMEENVGGVCGENNVGSIKNCYYLSDTDNGNNAKTQAQFINGCVAYKLSQGNNGGVWGQDLSKDNSLPVLNGERVYKYGSTYTNEKITDFDENGFHEISDGVYAYQEPEIIDGVYQIANAGNLYWFAEYVNQGGNNAGANAILTNNIVVNTEVLVGGELNKTFREWIPIGNDFNPYKGTFNGNEKTISGLYFNNSNLDYVGLFGYNNQGTIQNVGVVDSYFNGNSYVGGVSGYNDGTITNCYNTGVVSGNNKVSGVCGDNSQGTITNCYNTGVVSGKNDNIGGVCGYNFEGTIKNCYNTGEVSGSQYIGGVCGCNYQYSSTIENCYNTGKVSGSLYIGGVCGDNSNGTITNCYNTGEVRGSQNIGGVCGDNKGDFINCYNNLDIYDEDETIGVNKTTFDFCNGILFKDFSDEIWSAGSAKVENGVVTFTLPHFKNGYEPIIKGEFVVKVNSEKKYYFDIEFAKGDISKISINVGKNTYYDNDNKSNLVLTDTDLKDGLISGTFYGVEFSASVNLTDYTYKTQIFTWNTETVPPTAKVSAECNENSKHNIDNADCEITKVEGSEKAATCVKAGTVDYKATCKTLSDTKTIEVAPAIGHKYGEPTFSWTDYTKAVATFTCVNGDTTITVEGKITSEKTVEPTATQKGKMVYTATFEFNGNKFTDKKEQDLEPTPTHEISQNSQYKVWGYNGVVYIETENTDSQLQIFDINGRLIKSESLTNSHTEITINKKGVFVVVINNISYKVTL